MTDKICLPKSHLLIIFCTIIGFATWYIYLDKKNITNQQLIKTLLTNKPQVVQQQPQQVVQQQQQPQVVQQQPQQIVVQPQQPQQVVVQPLVEDIERRNYLTNRDMNVAYNDFAPPERRQPEHAYPMRYVRNRINVATRGLPDNHQIVGIAMRTNTETTYNLFGRQTYPGSNQYEYYVQKGDDNTSIKLPVQTKGDKEIEDGQIIMIPGTDHTKGQFKVKLYNYDQPRYNPYI